MYSLERVDCIFQFFCEGPQFDVVEEYTCNIYALKILVLTALLIFLLSTILFSVLKASIARICLRLMSFSYLADSPVTCISSTPCYLVGLFHNYSSALDSLMSVYS